METEHIVIRKPEFVVGSNAKAKIGAFVQTRSDCPPLKLEKVQAGQMVWLKFSSGPIVARAKILSVHDGVIENGDIRRVRELTSGTQLFNLAEYWNTISKQMNCFFVVVKLCDEEWLSKPIYPEVRSRGSSWIYLDTEERKKLWLSNH